MKRLGIATAVLLGYVTTAAAQVPQPGRGFSFLNGHGYSQRADPGRSSPVSANRNPNRQQPFLSGPNSVDPGRSYDFLNGHAGSQTADPGRAFPFLPTRPPAPSSTTSQGTSFGVLNPANTNNSVGSLEPLVPLFQPAPSNGFIFATTGQLFQPNIPGQLTIGQSVNLSNLNQSAVLPLITPVPPGQLISPIRAR